MIPSADTACNEKFSPGSLMAWWWIEFTIILSVLSKSYKYESFVILPGDFPLHKVFPDDGTFTLDGNKASVDLKFKKNSVDERDINMFLIKLDSKLD